MSVVNHIIGLDIGGTKTECCLFKLSTDGHGEFFVPHAKFNAMTLLGKDRIATDHDAGYDTYVSNVATLVKNTLEKYNLKLNEVMGIGIGLPGTIHPKTQIMLNGNTKMFIGHNFGKDLQQALKASFPVGVFNDANCFAMAEAFSGAGHKLARELGVKETELTSVGVILGTGVGGGLFIGGKCLTGSHGSAGEIGHLMLIKNGVKCYCGRTGCAESYLSGTALSRIYKDLTGEKIDGKEFFSRVKAGEENAKKVFADYKANLAEFFANLTNMLDLDYIVCGGGVSLQDMIYEGLEDEVNRLRFIDQNTCGRVRIFKHQISDSAGVLGAVFSLLNELPQGDM